MPSQYPSVGAAYEVTIPAVDDPANIVEAFESYHDDVITHLTAKANLAGATFTANIAGTNSSFAGNVNATTVNTTANVITVTVNATTVNATTEVNTVTARATSFIGNVIPSGTSNGRVTINDSLASVGRIFVVSGSTAPTNAQVGDIWMW
jgi:hypothetical protein